MLEALIAISDTPDGKGKAGDVIVLALPGEPWGTKDRTNYLIAQWEDDTIESSLNDRLNEGEIWPVVVYPYAVYQ